MTGVFETPEPHVLRLRCRGGLAAALQRALERYAFKSEVLECAAPTSAKQGV